MSSNKPVPAWALDHLQNNLQNGATVSNAVRVRRNLVLANTDAGAALVMRGILRGTRHILLANPRANASPRHAATWASSAPSQSNDDSYSVAAWSASSSKNPPVSGGSARPTEILTAANATTTPAPEPLVARDSSLRYPGDDHKVIDVEGIGPTYARRLATWGVETTDQLCCSDSAALAAGMELPLETILNWQAMAELMKVKGIGKQYAEALAFAGVRGIADLKGRSPGAIALQVNTYLDAQPKNLIGTRLSEKRVQGWQQAAKTMRRSKVKVRMPQRPAVAAPATASRHGSSHAAGTHAQASGESSSLAARHAPAAAQLTLTVGKPSKNAIRPGETPRVVMDSGLNTKRNASLSRADAPLQFDAEVGGRKASHVVVAEELGVGQDADAEAPAAAVRPSTEIRMQSRQAASAPANRSAPAAQTPRYGVAATLDEPARRVVPARAAVAPAIPAGYSQTGRGGRMVTLTDDGAPETPGSEPSVRQDRPAKPVSDADAVEVRHWKAEAKKPQSDPWA